MSTEHAAILAVGKSFIDLEAGMKWYREMFPDLSEDELDEMGNGFTEYLDWVHDLNSSILNLFDGEGFYIGFDIEQGKDLKTILKEVGTSANRWRQIFGCDPDIVVEVLTC